MTRHVIAAVDELPPGTREKLLHANATTFFGLDSGLSASDHPRPVLRSA